MQRTQPPADVASLMKHASIGVGPDATLAAVVRKMRAAGTSAVVLVTPGGIAGILTERDVMRAVADGCDASLTPAKAYATPQPRTVTPGEPATSAAALMVALGVRHLPVVEAGRLLGVVSARDLLRLSDCSRRLAQASTEPW